jgi:hypothetical protein
VIALIRIRLLVWKMDSILRLEMDFYSMGNNHRISIHQGRSKQPLQSRKKFLKSLNLLQSLRFIIFQTTNLVVLYPIKGVLQINHIKIMHN